MTGNLVEIAEQLGVELTDWQRYHLAHLSLVYDVGPMRISREPDTESERFRFRASQYVGYMVVDEASRFARRTRGPRPLRVDGHEYARRRRARQRRRRRA